MNKSFLRGMRLALPVCLGIVPVGISYGLLAMQTGLTAFETVSMSAIVMAGSSQLMALGMISQGASVISIIIAAFFVNLRHMVMSSSAMSYLQDTPMAKRLIGAFALCDESFAVFSLSDDHSFALLMGADVAMFLNWILSSALGCVLNQVVPAIVANSLGIAIYASFLAMLMPHVRENFRLLLLVCLCGLMNYLFQLFLPASWSIILSMTLGALIGVFFVNLDEEEEAHEQN